MRAHGARLVGPNCLGIAVAGVGLNATFAPRALPPGQDRLLVAERRARARAARGGRRARPRLLVASSRSATRPTSPRTTCSSGGRTTTTPTLVLLYLESFGNPRKFARIARRVARAQADPRDEERHARGAGARAASSHTAALAGSDAAVDALFRQAGVLRARHARGAARRRRRCSRASRCRAAAASRVLTNAGGLGILCADACEAAGLELPELAERDARPRSPSVLPAEASVANPVDLLGSATADDLRGGAARRCSPTRGVDAVIVLFVPPVVAGADEVAAAIRARRRARGRDKPVLAVVLSADGTPAGAARPGGAVAAFAYPESAARALGRRRRARRVAAPPGRHRARARRHRPPPRAAIVDAALLDGDDAWLDAGRDARRCSRPTASRSSPSASADTADEAVAAARELGFPVVVKTAAAGAHKTETRRRRARPRATRSGAGRGRAHRRARCSCSR